MLKKILNLHEKATDRRIRPLCEEFGASVYPKVRVADVLPIEGSGISDQDYQFCLQSHFDFVVADGEELPLFAVEFDGPRHQRDSTQQARDMRKNWLCNRFHLPLLRVSHDHVVEREGRAFLEYMVELHFLEKVVQAAVERGDHPPDTEYFPQSEFDGTSKIKKELHRRGICPPGWLLMLPKERESVLYYSISHVSLDAPRPRSGAGERCKATVQVRILKGWKQPQEIFSVKRTALLTDCSPNHDVLGVHGWHVAKEFAEFLCFQEVMEKVDRLLYARCE